MNKYIAPCNDKGHAHGYWELYRDGGSGEPYFKGLYINGNRSGYGELYDSYYNKLRINFHL